jgi:hypothetical protein
MHRLSFKIIHLITLLLLAWDAAYKEVGLSMWQILCNISTQWNSTFDMLNFIIKYCLAVDTVTNK